LKFFANAGERVLRILKLLDDLHKDLFHIRLHFLNRHYFRKDLSCRLRLGLFLVKAKLATLFVPNIFKAFQL